VGEELECRIMGRTTCTENSSVALKVKIELSRVTNVAVYHSACWTISAAIRIFIIYGKQTAFYSNQSQEK
jgi:hypothetical protein